MDPPPVKVKVNRPPNFTLPFYCALSDDKSEAVYRETKVSPDYCNLQATGDRESTLFLLTLNRSDFAGGETNTHISGAPCQQYNSIDAIWNNVRGEPNSTNQQDNCTRTHLQPRSSVLPSLDIRRHCRRTEEQARQSQQLRCKNHYTDIYGEKPITHWPTDCGHSANSIKSPTYPGSQLYM